MIALKIIEKAIKLLGYDTLQKAGSITDIDESAITALNAVYADLYFLINKEGFCQITNATQTVNLPEKALNDIMPYGVASFMASFQGDNDSQQFFSKIYNLKRKALIKEETVQDVIQTV
jgi:hypothetical protein